MSRTRVPVKRLLVITLHYSPAVEVLGIDERGRGLEGAGVYVYRDLLDCRLSRD